MEDEVKTTKHEVPTTEEQRFESAHNDMAINYLQSILQLLFFQGQKELDHYKKSIEMPNGGIYLLQLQHVTGQKINIPDIFMKSSEEAPAEKK